IAAMLDDFDASSVDANVVARRIGFRPELANRRAVHAGAAVEHTLLRGAPRRHAGLREDFLETLHELQRTSRTDHSPTQRSPSDRVLKLTASRPAGIHGSV